MPVKIRGIEFDSNLDNPMGLEFYNLSHRFGFQSPNWPYFEDVKIERIHYMAKSGVLSQRITTSMHNTTHIDAPAHVVEDTPFIDEVPLPHFFGSGIVVSIPKKMWEPITYDDLEKAAGKAVRPRDVMIVNTGWHHKYRDSEEYFCKCPGFVPSAGDWFVEKKVKVVGHDTQANDHPLATAIGPHRNGPLHPHLAEEYKKWSGGRDWKDDSSPLGAGASQALHQWHSRHRERRRRSRRRHRQARHLRVLPVELGSRRRLHHPSRRDDRQGPEVPHRSGRGALMLVKRLRRTRSLTRRPIIVASSGYACRASSRAARPTSGSAIRNSFPAAAPDLNSTPFEKVYVVLDGAMTVIVGGQETVLGPMDSCTIAPGEVRELVNRANDVCKMLVVIPYPPGAKP